MRDSENNSYVWLNGSIVQEKLASIPLGDRGFLFGDGVFTTIKVENGYPNDLEIHLERLKEHCGIINIIPPLLGRDNVLQLIDANQAFVGIWRLKIIVTGGEYRSLNLKLREAGTILMTLQPYKDPGKKLFRLAVYPHACHRYLGSVKSLSYLDQLHIKQYAIERGYDDALTLSPEGYVLETSCANIFWIVEKTLFTPNFNLPILKGISLNQVINDYINLGFIIQYVRITLDKIPNYASIFLTNSLFGVVQVSEIHSEQRNHYSLK